ncbi:MAG: hypothetical protein RJA22_1765 [Verrucomicrobiota bacterium]|jgi:hypothetical protein
MIAPLFASRAALVRACLPALLLGLAAAVPGARAAAKVTALAVHPAEIRLTTKADRQSLVVQATAADGTTRDVTAQAAFSFSDKRPARVDRAMLIPMADGKTELQVRYDGRTVTVPVTVERALEERPLSFKLDVMPVFNKAGCNGGGCHGSSRGKDGFHLSLFGYDPDGDYTRLTRQQVGRRLNLALPAESLLLEKSIGAVTHTGGERMKKGDPLYQTLLDWITLGAPKDSNDVAHVTSLEVMPRAAVLEGSNATQRLTVRARYSDGTDRDVTSLAVFISNNESTARASEAGVVTAGQRGEAFVMARYDSFTVGSQILVVPRDSRPAAPEALAANNYIDELVNAKLARLRLEPSEVCDDATFLRRLTLDITGTLPSPAALRQFLDDPSPAKREHAIESLLNRREFADLWVMKFAELLQIRSRQDQFSPKSAHAYYQWLREQMLANVPIDRIVRQLITASGSTLSQPAANYYQVTTDTLKIAENTAQVFMGMRIQCAQCHNHPFDRWTMNDYYAFASFFPQVGRKQGEDPREYIVYDRGEGEVKHPVTGKPLPPKFLAGDQPALQPGQSRREVLAQWLASPDNPFFARNLANIVWAHFLGKGIIDPVDDVRISNPASNPELLEALGAKFTAYGYDFKRLVRDICSSRAYQRSTRANASNALDDRNFSHAAIRRLRAEVLLDCLSQVTETRDKFAGLPRGARAIEIADGNTSSFFLTTFGRATRESACSCEVKVEPNLSQALHLLNGATVEGKINEGGLVKRLLKSGLTPPAIVDDLYLRCLSRTPTAEEKTRLLSHLKDDKQAESVLTDVFWAILNSKEFIFNH